MKLKEERLCRIVILFFAFQICFMFIIRTSSPLQDHITWRSTKVMRSLSSLPISKLPVQHDASKLSSKISLSSSRHLSSNPNLIEPSIHCDQSHRLYDWCHLRSPTILDPKRATFSSRSLSPSMNPPIVEKVRPYPRKTDINSMSNIREITLTTKLSHSPCTIVHDTPALVFSIGGYTGNFFHDFNDGFVPLFITINTLFPDQEVTLVITNYTEWWYGKYEAILPQFSSRPIINLDNQTVSHCFPSVVAGLITHGPMTINPNLMPHRKSFIDFHALLEEGYRKCLVWPPPKIKSKPRLVLVSRSGAVGRVILNQDNVIKAAQEEGFDVVIFEPSAYTYLCDVYRLINGSHAIMGVHGAALTHSLFLQPGAAFIQVVPLGGDWLARTYFRNLAKGMKLEYMEYKVQPEESSLVEKYGKDHIMIRDPNSITNTNWSALHNIYLRSQDVRLDIGRFRSCLKMAYAKAKRSMEHQGLHVKRRPKIKKFIRPPVFSYTYGVI
ncbi:protein O-linked-mannose beta-1,4-N-acetylglucosaminyltransferase 2-like [Chenopodium quinoa]|uniref:protein O-linked-mannose beta-1,4-N-acetylglucosaminyltransferase 2-like n=1 Tax=Chenopodium quinoa TaxID=63459 RepID=UPI000B776CB7|nr:protein O-linked-mannose beta-1,4-N-acetylglucosaminyltransferase 2-like [Chenopodium quinoa]